MESMGQEETPISTSITEEISGATTNLIMANFREGNFRLQAEVESTLPMYLLKVGHSIILVMEPEEIPTLCNFSFIQID